jgi:uncharacterized membrane protein YfhO
MRLTPGYTGLAPASVLDVTDRITQRIAGVAWRETAEGRWVPVPDSMPRARLLSTVQRSNDVKSDLHTIDISRIALVDRGIDAVSGSSGSVKVLEDRPGSIVVETQAGGTQLLVLTERFHEGWRASHDDRPRETARVYGDYLGCVVDPGEHRVRLTFAPDSARRGLQASVIGLTLTFVVTAFLWVARK